MKKVCGISLALLLSVTFVTSGECPAGREKDLAPRHKEFRQAVPRLRPRRGARPLILSGSVPMEGVKDDSIILLLPARAGVRFRACNNTSRLSAFSGARWNTPSRVCRVLKVWHFLPRPANSSWPARSGKLYIYDAAAFNLIYDD